MSSYVVGLTGGIGSGKSTVAAHFERRGIVVVDADAVSHELTRPGAAGTQAIRERLGDSFFGSAGELDRAALRAAAFSDPAVKARLEAVLHPMIRAEIDARLAASRSPYTLLMVPLLVESGPRYRQRIDRLLVVDVPEDVQVSRVVARSALAEQEVRAIMRAQASRDRRLLLADDVVDNSDGPEALPPQVERLDAMYRELAAAKADAAAASPPSVDAGARSGRPPVAE